MWFSGEPRRRSPSLDSSQASAGWSEGLERAGGEAALVCDWWEPARAVLAARWPDTPQHGNVQTLRSLPTVDVFTAGCPCQDLSQAGRMEGIRAERSGLVSEVLPSSRGSTADEHGAFVVRPVANSKFTPARNVWRPPWCGADGASP